MKEGQNLLFQLVRTAFFAIVPVKASLFENQLQQQAVLRHGQAAGAVFRLKAQGDPAVIQINICPFTRLDPGGAAQLPPALLQPRFLLGGQRFAFILPVQLVQEHVFAGYGFQARWVKRRHPAFAVPGTRDVETNRQHLFAFFEPLPDALINLDGAFLVVRQPPVFLCIVVQPDGQVAGRGCQPTGSVQPDPGGCAEECQIPCFTKDPLCFGFRWHLNLKGRERNRSDISVNPEQPLSDPSHPQIGQEAQKLRGILLLKLQLQFPGTVFSLLQRDRGSKERLQLDGR